MLFVSNNDKYYNIKYYGMTKQYNYQNRNNGYLVRNNFVKKTCLKYIV